MTYATAVCESQKSRGKHEGDLVTESRYMQEVSTGRYHQRDCAAAGRHTAG